MQNKLNIEPHSRDATFWVSDNDCDVNIDRDATFWVSTTNKPSEKFKNRYRIKSARLKGYDYSSNGAYFITICTKNREPFFGEIIDGEMKLSEMGKIANDCWEQIPQHFPFVQLGEFVIMPNHVHGIVIIDKNNDTIAETQNFASLNNGNKFGTQSQNLASIIRGFKIGVTKYARNNTDIFDIWQPRFHDHIIRNEKEFERITEYIINNPKKMGK